MNRHQHAKDYIKNACKKLVEAIEADDRDFIGYMDYVKRSFRHYEETRIKFCDMEAK